MPSSSDPVMPTCVAAIVVTHDRPALLACCLAALATQTRRPDMVIVVDNASAQPAAVVAARHLPHAHILRQPYNAGAAAGFNAGIDAALRLGATHLWLMDDDGRPGAADALAQLLTTSRAEDAAFTCPLVRDCANPARLAFPIRTRGRTRFAAADLDNLPLIRGFAHLFNGALITAETFTRIGRLLESLVIRGDEVEFLLRAKRAGLRIVTDTRVAFLHPSSTAEIHPILNGAFYAVVPQSPVKQHYQFRNRGWIFTRYGKWGWLAADHVRYGLHFLADQRDLSGYAAWLAATWAGVAGRLDAPGPQTGLGPAPVFAELQAAR